MQRRLGATVESPTSGSLSYIEALRERIQTLQAQAQGGDIQETSPSTQAYTVATRQDGAHQTQDVLAESGTAHGQQDDLHDTMQEASYLALASMAERTDRQPFSTQGLSFLTLLYAAIGISGANPATSLESNTAHSGPLAEFRKSMFTLHADQPRSFDTASYLQYVEIIQHSYPFMTKAELDEMGDIIKEVQGSTALNCFGDYPPEIVFMTYISLAIALLQSPGYSYKEALATEYAVKAIDLIPQVFDYANDLTIVKCLAALTVYSLYTTFGGSAWHLLGLTMTRCVASGMHTSRVSEPASGDEDKEKSCRILWTLYSLDTYISTTLDRPFCLNDEDIMISQPSSTGPYYDAELLRMVEHAQLIRTMRHQSNTDAWIHYINLRHWYETVHPPAPPSQVTLPTLRHNQLLIRGFIELIKQPSSKASENWAMILCGAEPDIVDYLNIFENYLLSQCAAPSTFDPFEVFAASVLIMQLPMDIEPGVTVGEYVATGLVARQRSVAQAINILTMLSVRYPSVQSFRDVLLEYRNVCSTGSPQLRAVALERLQSLVARSEVKIPLYLQHLITSEPRR
jgi:hypothetical protein